MRRSLRRREILAKVGLAGAAFTAGLMSRPVPAQASDADAILGLWSVRVSGSNSAKYNYMYAFARGAYTANGDIDQNYQGTKFSPTVGAYVLDGNRTVRYREQGWTYTLAGSITGTFESIGTFTLDVAGNSLSGPGVFRMRDANGKIVYRERFTANGKRLTV